MLSRDQDRDLGLQVLRPRPRPWTSGLETKTETLAIRSRYRDRDLDKMNSSALESRDHGLEITTLLCIRQTDGRTDRIGKTISRSMRACMLTRDINELYFYFLAQSAAVYTQIAIQFLRFRHSIALQGDFFYRATLCVSAVFAVGRCPSVRPSVTLVHWIHMAEDTVKLLCRPGSPSFYIF